jgi:hypothetical protein
MTSHRLLNPIDLFALANCLADALAEKATLANLNSALELMTKLQAAMYAYGAYLVIEDSANRSAFARTLLQEAARAWQCQVEELRQWLLVFSDHSLLARPGFAGGPA